MKLLSSACFQILSQLEDIVEQFSPQDFSRPSSTLGGSSIGQHLRHTLEFFQCLETGFEAGVINYDRRNHDKRIETDKSLAISSINRVRDFVRVKIDDKALTLEVSFERHSRENCIIQTYYSRELAYNIEHAIHHMAIMKIGVREVAPYVQLPDHFGVAASTVRYHEGLSVEVRNPSQQNLNS